MSDRDSDFGAFLIGFVVGGLVGAAVALLMAPQSGEETRTVIREKGIEIKDRAMETAEEARERAEKFRKMHANEPGILPEARTRATELAALSKEKAVEPSNGRAVPDEQRSRIEGVIETARKPPSENTCVSIDTPETVKQQRGSVTSVVDRGSRR
jgi:gas vesicle protein